MTFNKYSTRYRPGLDLVLNDVSIDINGGEKVYVFFLVLHFLQLAFINFIFALSLNICLLLSIQM